MKRIDDKNVLHVMKKIDIKYIYITLTTKDSIKLNGRKISGTKQQDLAVKSRGQTCITNHLNKKALCTERIVSTSMKLEAHIQKTPINSIPFTKISSLFNIFSSF